jgi:hypothetical protein
MDFFHFWGGWLFGWTLFYPSMSPAIYFSKIRLKRSFFTPLFTKLSLQIKRAGAVIAGIN